MWLYVAELTVLAAAVACVPALKRAGERSWEDELCRRRFAAAGCALRDMYATINAAVAQASVGFGRMAGALRDVGRTYTPAELSGDWSCTATTLRRSAIDRSRIVVSHETWVLSPRCPECRAGKHGNCDGTAWDNAADAPASCGCAEAGHR